MVLISPRNACAPSNAIFKHTHAHTCTQVLR